MQTEQLLCWSGMTDIEHSTSSSSNKVLFATYFIPGFSGGQIFIQMFDFFIVHLVICKVADKDRLIAIFCVSIFQVLPTEHFINRQVKGVCYLCPLSFINHLY